jgi:hypothetical protein
MSEPHLCELRPALEDDETNQPHCPESVASARRLREAEVMRRISTWFETHRISVLHSVGSGTVVAAVYDIAPVYTEPLPPAHPTHTVEVTLGDQAPVWRPRVAKLLWDTSLPYFSVFLWLRALFRTNRTSAADNAPGEGRDDAQNRHACAKSGQSIERALVAVYHGAALEAEGKLKVPELTTRTAAAYQGGKRRRAHSAQPTFAERVSAEKRSVERKLEHLREFSGGFPGFHSIEARRAITRAYVVARLGLPHRGSQVDNAPMLIACAIRVLMPHVAPVTPSAPMAERVAAALHAHVVERQPAHFAAMVSQMAPK